VRAADFPAREVLDPAKLIGPESKPMREATSIAPAGRLVGSFERHAATVSSQAGGIGGPVNSSSARRSTMGGGVVSSSCRAMFPEWNGGFEVNSS
jgi:hypothetical protein